MHLKNIKSGKYKPSDIKDMPYKNTHAWVLENPKFLDEPVSYKHPNGDIIWVKLNEEVISQIK